MLKVRTAGARSWLAVLCFLFLSAHAAAAASGADRKLQEDSALFGALPRLNAPTLSPNGAHVAALEPVDGHLAVIVRPLDHLDQSVIVYRDSSVTVDWMRWVNDDRLIVGVSFPGRRYGIDTIETRLYGVDRDGRHKVTLPSMRGRRPQVGTDLVSILRKDPTHILLNFDRDSHGVSSVYRVDTSTGEAQLEERGSPLTADWICDPEGVVRLRIDLNGTAREIWARSARSEPWRLVRRDDVMADRRFIPLAFRQSDPNSLIVATDLETGHLAIHSFDIASSKLGPVLYQRSDVDVEGIIQDAASGAILGYTFTGDREVQAFLNADLDRRQSELDALFPGQDAHVVSTARNGTVSLVYVEGPGRPGRYLIRTIATGAMKPLGSQYPALDHARLAEVVPWTFAARDGLQIHGYVTLPAGAKLSDQGGRWPLVVMPHGGPAARDSITFDFIAQFLARQGYAVLQPNFRGSIGYGRDFELAGYGEWGRAMQDDVTDGARALMASGFADPKRIAIVGASYGGYSALMGAVREPDMFRAAVSISGVTDLKMFLRAIDHFRFAAVRRPQVVKPANDAAALRERSPVDMAGHIKIPVLLVHGRKDHVVPIEHALAMRTALKRVKTPVELVTLPETDHTYSVGPERVATLEAIGAFLAKALE